MSGGAPDYGPGDLVVAVCMTGRSNQVLPVGSVHTVIEVRAAKFAETGWLVRASCGAFAANRFRRLDPHPPEFFAGNADVGVKEVV